MASQYVNLVTETFFLAVSNGSVTGLKEIVAENGPEVAVAIAKTLNSKGETPLHVAIKGQHLEMVKFLVQNLKADIGQLGQVWNGPDYLVAPPLLSAILYDNSPGESIINFLMKQDAANESSVVLNSIKSSNLPLQDKMDLLKFVGAAYKLNPPYFYPVLNFVKKCWYDALALRTESTNTTQMVPTRFSEWARNAGGINEFTTMEELKRMESEMDTVFDCHALFKFQSLLVIERIGSRILRGPLRFFLRRLFKNHCFLLVYGPSLSLDLLMLLFEGFQQGQWEHVFNSEWVEKIFYDLIVSLIFEFWDSHRLPPNDPQKLTFVRIMDVLRCLSGLHSEMLQHPVARVSLIARNICESMVHFFSEIPQLNPTETEEKEFKLWLGNYISGINGHSGVRTPLHFACYFRNELIPLLLAAGADSTAADENRWAPLHFLFQGFQSNEGMSVSVHLILAAGAHMDQLNSDGQRPLDFCKLLQLSGPYPHLDAIVKNALPFSLSCFCAQAISRNKIPFDKLPPKLKTFVKRHGAQK